MDNDLVAEAKYTYNGIPVPRVTTVINSMIYEESLLKWANYLGFKHKDYKKVAQEALDIGTMAHEQIELILTGKSTYQPDSIIPVQSFWMWYKQVKANNSVRTIFTEKSLSCELYGGTLDAVLEINGKTYLIDFKTSKIVTYKYFLQLAAYRKMLREALNMDVDGIIILQLGKTVPSFKEYSMTSPQYNEFMDFYETTFISLVIAYANILKAQSMFKEYLLSIEK